MFTNPKFNLALPTFIFFILTACGGIDNTPINSKITLQSTVGDAQVTLNWNAIDNANIYTVYQNNNIQASTTDTKYTVSNLSNETAYTFQVQAFNVAGTSLALSNTITATPFVVLPNTPTISQVFAGNRQITLQWNRVTYANSYTIVQSDGNTNTEINTKNTSRTIMGLTNGNAYIYKIKAVGMKRESGFSTAVSITPTLPAPTGITLVTGISKVDLSWNDVPNADSYLISYKQQQNTNLSTKTVTTSTVSISGLDNNTTYVLTIAARDGEHISAKLANIPFILTSSTTSSDSPYSKNRLPSYSFSCDDISSIDLSHITDEYYGNQYYLTQMGIQTAWQNQLNEQKCFGNGITVTLVDDGVDSRHEDLFSNIDLTGSYDFISNKKSIIPTPQTPHGTFVAGIVAANANGFGVVGISNKSKIQSYNILSANPQSIANKVSAMSATGEISNNSWGPSDAFPILAGSSQLWKLAIDNGVENGRQGKGTIYVWAGGNGGMKLNNSNYDGYVNYRKVIAVGATDGQNKIASFSEEGANILITAPGLNIYTTQLTPSNAGEQSNGIDNRYMSNFGGTSSAAPMVSGVIALLLETYPNLGWRDVRKIIALSAKRIDSGDADWTQNGAQYWVNHKYGYGLIDAPKMLETAKNWTNLTTETAYKTSQTYTSNNAISTKVSSVFTLSVPANTGISKLEAVEININTEHPYWADLSIELLSPQGTKSILTKTHKCDKRCGSANSQSLKTWIFSSARLIDENPHGEWKVLIKDGFPDENNGTVTKISLNLYGT
jgi:subtilisin-like proprotein convertase family protein/chitodextrinase